MSSSSVFSEPEDAIKFEPVFRCKTSRQKHENAQERTKLECKSAFSNLKGCCLLGENADNGIYYSIENSLLESNPDLYRCASTHHIRIFAWCHYRRDARLPYYKSGVFSKSWVREKCRPFEEDKGKDIYILPVACVVSRKDVNFYIVHRDSASLRLSVWIFQSLFSLFESPKDKLESERCAL